MTDPLQDLLGPHVAELSMDEWIAMNRAHPCPFDARQEGGDVRVTWGDDPLDFIVITKAQAVQLIHRLQTAIV